MARTPLFRALERSLRLARLELATGRPAAELAGEAGARRPRPPAKPLSRRDFAALVGDLERVFPGAGEHTADDGQGFMEGGGESGERVAAEILAGLGRGRVAA